MPTIRIATVIDAPPERCFDLARDVDAHLRSTARTGERTVSGVTVDLFDLEDEVTWEARHVGVRRRLTAIAALSSYLVRISSSEWRDP